MNSEPTDDDVENMIMVAGHQLDECTGTLLGAMKKAFRLGHSRATGRVSPRIAELEHVIWNIRRVAERGGDLQSIVNIATNTVDGCAVVDVSSAMCSRGVKGCAKKHSDPESSPSVRPAPAPVEEYCAVCDKTHEVVMKEFRVCNDER